MTTQLNTPGPDLACIEGVHALTDVTGFGLAGHTLEMARAAGLSARLNMRQIPVLQGVRQWAEQGTITGASGRNWAAYGPEVMLGAHISTVDRDLLTDPQTSGGLLIACAPDVVGKVMDTLARHGFGQAAEIGEMDSRMTSGHALGID